MPDTPQPDTRSLAWKRQEEAAKICRDAYSGPLAIRKEGETYLPKFPRESEVAYKDRLNTSVFYDATARTVRGLTGMIFRKPPQLAEDFPDDLRVLWENIDLKGTHGEVFCRRRHRDGEVDGHFVIFVDMQRVRDGEIRSRAQEQRAGLRPYWIGVQKMDVFGFEETEVAGKMVLSHLRFGEKVTVRNGYAEKEEERVREYNLTIGEDGQRGVSFIIWAKREVTGEHGVNKVEWVRDDEGTLTLPGGKPMDEIPAAVGYVGEEVGTLETVPPHLSLALENVKHYQLTSDNDNVLHLCSVPIFTRIGFVDEGGEEVRSPNAGIDLPAGGDAKYVEPEGHGLEAMERRIAKSEERMALLGLSLLHSETRAPETATSKRIDKAESDSALADHARASQDAFEEAIRLTAKWLGIEDKMPAKDDEARWLALNKDFTNTPLDAPTITALSNMVAQGQLTLATLWDMLERGEMLPTTFDAEVEEAKLESVEPQAATVVPVREEREEREAA